PPSGNRKPVASRSGPGLLAQSTSFLSEARRTWPVGKVKDSFVPSGLSNSNFQPVRLILVASGLYSSTQSGYRSPADPTSVFWLEDMTSLITGYGNLGRLKFRGSLGRISGR